MKKINVKKAFSCFVSTLLVFNTLFLMGCQKKEPNAQATSTSNEPVTNTSNEPVTLEVYSWTVVDSMTPFFDAFQKKYPNIKINYTKMADALPATANVLLSSGASIDVIPQPSVDDMRLRATSGMYEPLDNYLKADKIDYAKTFGSAINSLEVVNDKHYALPYSIATYGLYYNKALFDKAGVAYPTDNWTWEDLRAAALKLTSGSGSTKTYGFLSSYVDQWNFPAIQQLGTDYIYKNNGKESNWDNPAFLSSLQLLYDMEMKDKSAWPISEFKALKIDTNPHAIFLQGKVAMYINPSYTAKYSSQASYGFTNFDYGVVNIPKVASGDGLKSVFNISDYSMPVSSKHKQAAWTFLKFYCMEASEIFAQSKAMTPANISSIDSSLKTSVGKIIFDYPHFDQASGMKTFITNQMTLTPILTTITTAKAEIIDLVKNEVSTCLMGNETPAQAIANMKKNSDDQIKKALNK